MLLGSGSVVRRSKRCQLREPGIRAEVKGRNEGQHVIARESLPSMSLTAALLPVQLHVLSTKKVCPPGSCILSDGSSRLQTFDQEGFSLPTCLSLQESHLVTTKSLFVTQVIRQRPSLPNHIAYHEQLSNHDIAQSDSFSLRPRNHLSPYHEQLKGHDLAQPVSLSLYFTITPITSSPYHEQSR
jgi:hypothetical protein